ncbi:MAG: hypothetical protein M3540_04855 [Actinomycetota bacterium]|nr:hypothetical protein [Actinomycetota bacterium]
MSIVLAAIIVVAVAVGLGAAKLTNTSASAVFAGAGDGEASPAMSKKLAAAAKFAPPGGTSDFKEGDRTEDDEWVKHAIPGDDIPSAAIAQSSRDWNSMTTRGGWNNGQMDWKPLGPDWGKSLPNAFRDRAVYNAGTPDFSGRAVHLAIDPRCGTNGNDNNGHCRLWIANANGGVWRTENALEREQFNWKYLSEEFEHNSVASLELDPNDNNFSTIWAGTGEPNACGSGCEAGVGLYKSTNGGNTWSGPYGKEHFYNRAVGSIEVKPGNSSIMFAASGRAIRGLTSSCCGGADALIPGAPHFGLYRSLDGGQNWQLVHQGAAALCTAAHPDTVSLSGTPCSPRGARRVKFDPVDPNTVYAGFFGRGIWRSRSNGDPGTWEQIMLPVTPTFATAAGGAERPEFDIVELPSGETRMYVGVGGGGVFARLRRNDAVRTTLAAATAASWTDLTSPIQDTPGYSSFGYCDGQCSYDNYVFVPAGNFPDSGANPDIVYLVGDNEYNENNWGPLSPRYQGGNFGRGNGRGIALSTNGGVSFTDMTDDTSDNFYPFELHPDHHALTVNPGDWKQFIEVGDGGVVRSNGVFVDDSADCVQPKGYTGTRLTFCQMMLAMVPERLESMNKGLRTLHFYQIDYSPHDPSTIIGGTQDNGSWERGDTPESGTNGSNLPSGYDPAVIPSADDCVGKGMSENNNGNGTTQIWVNTNIADGGDNGFDIGDPCFRLSGWQSGQMMVAYEPKNQLDMNWIADTQFVFYGGEANAFRGVANDDHTVPHRLWSARQHVFRSDNQGRNPILTKETHRIHCNVWYGDADVDDNGIYEPPKDICDDWQPLGDPGPAGRLSDAAYGATRQGGYVSVVEPAWDGQTIWAATQVGRVFVSKNAGGPEPAVVFDRIDDDPTATNTPPRFPSAIYVDPLDSNHAWITYSGFNAKTPATPGHVFEVRYIPGASTFQILDGNEPSDQLGDIPATSIAVSDKGTIYVGTDFGVVASKGDGRWQQAGKHLPRMPVPDLVYVRDVLTPPYKGKNRLYAGTHGQGAWELKTDHLDGG